MLHIAICDDEKIFIIREKNIISEYLSSKQQEFLIDTYLSGEGLLKNLSKKDKYDVVFLDIRMINMNGIETARRLRQLTRDVYIVFVSAMHRFAIDGYKVMAFRYIVKRNSTLKKELTACIEDILDNMIDNEPRIEFRFTDAVIEVALKDIVYVESKLHYLVFHLTNNRVHKLKGKLDDMEKYINDNRFCRTHQSFLLNLEYADVLRGDKIEIIDRSTEIPVTRNRFNDVKNQYLIHKGII